MWARRHRFALLEGIAPRGDFSGGEAQGRGELADRLGIGQPAQAALKQADGVDRQPCPFGKLLLGEAGRLAVAPELRPERAGVLVVHTMLVLGRIVAYARRRSAYGQCVSTVWAVCGSDSRGTSPFVQAHTVSVLLAGEPTRQRPTAPRRAAHQDGIRHLGRESLSSPTRCGPPKHGSPSGGRCTVARSCYAYSRNCL